MTVISNVKTNTKIQAPTIPAGDPNLSLVRDRDF